MAQVALNCYLSVANARYAQAAKPAPRPKPKLAVASYADGELEDQLIQPMIIVGFERVQTSKAELLA
jgi:hypothetical protein